MRARLVAREMMRKKVGWDTVFAGTPPLWAFRALLSSSRTMRLQPRGAGPRKLRIIDIRRAFFHSDHDGIHALPPHLVGTGKCWRLRKAMYGTLSAAGDFQDMLIRVLGEELHMKGGGSNPCLYHEAVRDLKVVCHGGDVAAEGHEEHLNWFTASLGQFFELEVKATLGPQEKDDKTASLLNRLLTFEAEYTFWENDPRQVELAIAELGLVGAKPKPTPGVKLSLEEWEKAGPLTCDAARG